MPTWFSSFHLFCLLMLVLQMPDDIISSSITDSYRMENCTSIRERYFSIHNLLLSFVFLFWSKEWCLLFMISLFGCYGSVLVNVHDLPLTKLIRIRILDRQRFSYEYLNPKNSSIAKKANYIFLFWFLHGLIVSLCWQLLIFPWLPKCLIVLQNQVLTWWRQSQSTCKFLCLL